MRLTVRTKIVGLACVLLALMMLVGAVAIHGLGAVNSRGSSMYADRVVPIRDLAEVRALLGDVDSQIQRAITDSGGDDGAYVEAVTKDVRAIDELVEGYEATKLVAAEQRGLRGYHASWQRYQKSVEALLADATRGDDAGAIREYYARADSAYAQVDADVAELIRVNDVVAERLDRQIASTYGRARGWMIALIVLGAGAGLAIALFIGRQINRGVARLLQAARGLAVGEIDQEVRVATRDEIGDMAAAFGSIIAYNREMAHHAERIAGGDLTADVHPKGGRDALGNAFATMTSSLRDLVGDIAGSAGTLSSSSHQMAATSEQAGRAVGEIASAVGEVAQGAERQVRMVEATRAAIDDAARAAGAGAETARATADAAAAARRVAGDGVTAAEEASHVMTAVAASSQQVSTAIEELSVRSQRIGGIVDTITGLAEQTNLLALNAAIEAARAGEQGRGFAVVAEEVRKLAEGSQSAAGQIAGLVSEIQAETGKVVGVVADGAAQTQEGVLTVDRARAAFEAIGAAVEDMGARVDEIAATIEDIGAHAERAGSDVAEVTTVAEESSASAEQVSASTQQTSASTQEISASAQALAATAEQLDQLVGRFALAT